MSKVKKLTVKGGTLKDMRLFPNLKHLITCRSAKEAMEKYGSIEKVENAKTIYVLDDELNIVKKSRIERLN